jgi:hypothetical protein
MSKLLERALVKDLLGIARADSFYDYLLDSMVQQASEEVGTYCRRVFERSARVEFFKSYDQMPGDTDSQYVWLDGPVDLAEQLELRWSDQMDHDTNGIVLERDRDYRVDTRRDVLIITGYYGNISSVSSRLMAYIRDHSQGFKVRYTGGYAVSEEPGGHTADPTDDFGVTAVPPGLKMAIAQKIAKDWRAARTLPVPNPTPKLTPWTDEDLSTLRPWKKMDTL